jgi:CysZ protein
MTRHPTSGFGYLLRGFRLLGAPGLKRFVFFPLLINIVLFSALFYTLFHYFSQLIAWMDHSIPSWLHFLNWIIWPFFLLACFFVFAYTFIIIASIVSAPFNCFLAEKVELIQTGKNPNENLRLKETPKELARVMLREWHKVLYYIPRILVLLLLFLIPGINIIAGVLWFVFGCWAMAIQYLDYPMDNHKISFVKMRQQMRQRLAQSLSFGCAIVLVLMIPILNFFVIPAAVIGATLMWLDNQSTHK